MDCHGHYYSLLWRHWTFNLMILTLEENKISAKHLVIDEFSTFLKSLAPGTEIHLLFKTQDVQFHSCPVRKAVPFLKSAEFSPDHWVGEKIIAHKQTFIGGILPSPFMRKIISILAEKPIAVGGTHVWDDVVVRSFGDLPNSWVMILHEQHVFVCLDGILRLSRPCFTVFSQELSAILRYLKRFGYEAETPLTLLTSLPLHETVPPFIHVEVRTPADLCAESTFSDALNLKIGEIKTQIGLYRWSRIVSKIVFITMLISVCNIGYLSWDLRSTATEKKDLQQKISLIRNQVQSHASFDQTRMSAFANYQDIPRGSINPLPLFQQISILLKEEAVVTQLHWSPNLLRLQIVLNETKQLEPLVQALSSQLKEYKVEWTNDAANNLQGVLTLSKKINSGLEVE